MNKPLVDYTGEPPVVRASKHQKIHQATHISVNFRGSSTVNTVCGRQYGEDRLTVVNGSHHQPTSYCLKCLRNSLQAAVIQEDFEKARNRINSEYEIKNLDEQLALLNKNGEYKVKDLGEGLVGIEMAVGSSVVRSIVDFSHKEPFEAYTSSRYRPCPIVAQFVNRKAGGLMNLGLHEVYGATTLKILRQETQEARFLPNPIGTQRFSTITTHNCSWAVKAIKNDDLVAVVGGIQAAIRSSEKTRERIKHIY